MRRRTAQPSAERLLSHVTISISSENAMCRRATDRHEVMKVYALAAVTALAVLLSHESHAAKLNELASVMEIDKSSNRNQVHYALAVDASCAPVGAAPVRPYWQMLERGPSVTEPLEAREERVLGIERQEVWATGVQFALRGMPGRTFIVHTSSGDDSRCSSWVETTIAGIRARLGSVFVQQRVFGMVDYVKLEGAREDGVVVSERVTP